MEELKAVFAANLIVLRTGAGMTQTELAEKLHYSDKSVSKWERAEAVPDAYVLTQIAAIFGVTVDELLVENTRWERKKKSPPVEYSRRSVVLCTLAGIWTLCMLEFVILWILGHVYWITFVAAVPISLIVLLIFNSAWNAGRHNVWLVAVLVAAVVVLVYLAMLRFNLWQLFLVLVPAEAVVFLAFRIPLVRKHK